MVKAAYWPIAGGPSIIHFGASPNCGANPQKEAAMTRSKRSTKAVFLAGATGLSTAVFAAAQPAAAQPYSDENSCPAGDEYDLTYVCCLPGQDYYGYYNYPYSGFRWFGGDRELGHGAGTSVNHGASATVLRGSSSQGLARLADDGFNHAMAGNISNVYHGLGFAHSEGGGFFGVSTAVAASEA